MQFLVLVINMVMNAVLVFIATVAVRSRDDETAVHIWTGCAWTSAALIVANAIFCIVRMILLWRRGRKKASLGGPIVLAVLLLASYHLYGAYLFALLLGGGPIGGD